MDTQLNVAMAPKDSTFQVRINSEIKKAVEEIYAKAGMTLTDAFNIFIQQYMSLQSRRYRHGDSRRCSCFRCFRLKSL